MEDELPSEESDEETTPPTCSQECGFQTCKSHQFKTPKDTQKVPIVWVLGGPGSGKSTQCEMIIEKYGFTHLSLSDLLRAEIKSGSNRAKSITLMVERGELVPNDLVLELLKEAIDAKRDTAKGFLIDGYPREKSQSVAFEQAIAPVTVILYFDATAETLTKRLLARAETSGRSDDNENTIKLRLKTFMEHNDAVIAQYPDKIKRINAEKSVDNIFGEVQKILDPIVEQAEAVRARNPLIDTQKVPIVWVLGGPGSGKSTQCEKIIEEYGFTHLSLDDLLRAEVESGSDRAKSLTYEYFPYCSCELIPNDLVLELLKEAIDAKRDTAKGFLIDGYPREKLEGVAFEQAIAPVTVILYFDATAETLTKRLLARAETSCLSDDNEATVKLRLKTFMEQNDAVIAQYPDKLQRIDAEKSVDIIFSEVQQILDPIVAKANAAREPDASHYQEGSLSMLERIEIDSASVVYTPPIDTQKVPIVWVLGGPGSGKSTQCEKIIEKYGFAHLSLGDLLRAEIKSGSDRAKSLTLIVERGELVPNDLVLELLKEAIEAKRETAKGFLIDGYPREKSQSVAFEQAIAPVTVILYFEATAETLTKRLLARAETSGRSDDNENTIKLRLKTFMEHNDAVIALYPDKLKRIDAEKSVDIIFGEVQKILDPIAAKAKAARAQDACDYQKRSLSELEHIEIDSTSVVYTPPIDTQKVPIVWVLGGPGSGKSTQCEKIIEKYGFTHLSLGDLLRAEIKSGSDRAKSLTLIVERGELVPNVLVLELLKEAIEAKRDTAKGFLIDGYPREKSQSVAFEQAIAPVTVILYFEATEETLTKRLLARAETSGRSDDNENTINLRLKTFMEHNDAVIAQYPDKLKRIDAEKSVDIIFGEVQKILDPIAVKAEAARAQDACHCQKQLRSALEHIEIDSTSVVYTTPIDTQKVPIVWVLGSPGSGKSTQCEKIIEKYGFTHLSLGDLLRAEIKSGSDRAKSLTLIVERGELVPNDLVLELLKEGIEAKRDTAKGFLIDDYPREKSQSVAFEQTIAPVTVILYFEATAETLTKRLLARAETCCRLDDNENTIKLLLKTFMEHNDAVVAQYSDKLKRIDAEKSVDIVFGEVQKILDPIVAKVETACAQGACRMGETRVPDLHESVTSNEMSQAVTESGCCPTTDIKPPIDTQKVPIVWVLGGPGSGKSTQCERIIEKYGFTHLSLGDLLRAEIISGSDRAKSLTLIMERCELVPNDLVLELLKEAIDAKRDTAKGFLIDGYPREKSQSVAFEQAIGLVTVILYFDATAETLTKRLLARAETSGRSDDNENTIKLRLKTFMEHNDAVIAQYPDKLKRIDAEKSVDIIFGEVQKVLDPIAAKDEAAWAQGECQVGEIRVLDLDESVTSVEVAPAVSEFGCYPTTDIKNSTFQPPIIDNQKVPIVWVLGGPGSGKSTQCEKIIEKYGFTHLSLDDLLRAEIKSGSDRAKSLALIKEQGELVPNNLVLELLKEAIDAKRDTAKGFLIDGYPRQKLQGVAFEQSIAPATVILYFEATAETLTKRLLARAETSGRSDNNENTIKLRLKTFMEHNDAVIAQYPNKLQRIDAEKSVGIIFYEVQKILDPIVAKAEAAQAQDPCRKRSLLELKPIEIDSTSVVFTPPILDSQKVPIVWVLGGPGSGKFTQCEMIIEKYGFTHLSLDNLLRAEIESGSDRAKSLTLIKEQGELVPNDLVLELLKEAIDGKRDTAKGFLIDGYPREKSQGVAFEQSIAPVTVILYFEATAETLTERLLARAKTSGRSDDNENTIKLRLKTFMEHNDALIAQYPDKLKRIDAEKSVGIIFREVQKILDPIVAKTKAVWAQDACRMGDIRMADLDESVTSDEDTQAVSEFGGCPTTDVKPPIIDNQKVPIVWALGGPGSGKDTQCEKIIKKYGFTHLSLDDLLRAEIKSGSDRAKSLTLIKEQGEVVPNDLILELLKEAINAKRDTAKGFLIDGYPREKSQGVAFEQSIAPVTVILYFEATAETLTKRLLTRAKTSCRSDDNENTIKLQLKTFMEHNDAVIAQYPDKLKRINAEKSVGIIFREVQKILDPIVAKAEKLGK